MLNPFVLNAYRKMYRGFYYTIQADETLETISKRYKVPVNNIIISNNLHHPYILKEGEKIFVPGVDEPVAVEGSSIYTVKFGDTLEKIAQKFGASHEEIMSKNFISDKRMLFVGQKLLMPKANVISDQTESQNDEIKVYPLTNPSGGTKLGHKFSELKLGARGRDVSTLQQLLSALGHRIKRMDGYFGHDLMNAVKEFQRKYGLTPDGIVTSVVWDEIFNSINKKPGAIV